MNVACQFDHEIADNPSFSLMSEWSFEGQAIFYELYTAMPWLKIAILRVLWNLSFIIDVSIFKLLSEFKERQNYRRLHYKHESNKTACMVVKTSFISDMIGFYSLSAILSISLRRQV